MFDQVEAFYRPTSVSEAVRLLQRSKGKARIVAGGTGAIASGNNDVRVLVDITHAGLSYIRPKPHGLAIGATTKLAEIEESELVRGVAGGILPRAVATCGSASIRNMATLGGNMTNASWAADVAVPLLLLDASAVVADAHGRRKISLADYLAGATGARLSQWILVEVIIPEARAKRCGWSFQKLARTAVDVSVVSVAAGLELDARGRVEWARLALGSVAPTALRAGSAERLLIGQTVDAGRIAAAAADVALAVSPVSDVRASSEYRREMSCVLTARALSECVAQAGGSL